VNGVNLHYEKAGCGNHVLLCIPGALGSTQSDFGPQLKGLCKDFTVIAFDPRGYGKSIPPVRDFPDEFFPRDASDAGMLMKVLGYSKYSLLGWSDGGIAAMILAYTNPKNVQSMVVWGSNSYITKEDLEMLEPTRDTSAWNPKMRDPLEAVYGAEGLKNMWSGWLDAFTRIYNKKGGNLCKDYLPMIWCPTLIVHGVKDPLVPMFHPEYLHKHIPGSTLHLMPDGRHNLHLRYEHEFNNLVTDFLKKHAHK
ncbi:predicted protein, partial [Nematostella vectensis]